MAGCVAVFGAALDVVAAGVEELDCAEEFGKIDVPVLGIAVGVVGMAACVALAGCVAVFCADLAVVAVGVEKLD